MIPRWLTPTGGCRDERSKEAPLRPLDLMQPIGRGFEMTFVLHHGQLPITTLSQREIEDLIASDVKHRRGGWLVTANLDHLRRMHDDHRLREHVARADLVVADGMPLVWTSRIAGKPLPGRIAGSDLIYTLSERAAREDQPIFLLGGREGAAQEASARLRSRYPGLTVSGTFAPPIGFESDERSMADAVKAVAEANPAIVFVALGFPKQDLVIPHLRAAHPTAWYIGVGASVDFVAGHVARSPLWMQSAGLEWVHRLASEPRRMTNRYLVQGLPFATRLFAWAIRERVRKAQKRVGRR